MKQHVYDLYEHVRTSSAVVGRSAEWETVKRRVKNQVPLRVLSCCRLATQLVSNCQVTHTTLRRKCNVRYF